jgi:CRISPR-associated protein Cas2
MLIIVTYDVSTETREGRKRLRRVAKICECKVNLMQYEELERRLLAEIDEKEDNLRLYRLTEPVELHVKEYGKFKAVDFDGSLIV